MQVPAPRGHVLLVDDDAAIRASYAHVLRRRGYTFCAAPSGQAAHELLARESFDAVLSDIAMPGLDGIGLLKLVRASGNLVPFVLMTGSPQTEHAIDALSFGAARFLLKPLDVDALGVAVDDAVRRGRDERAAREWIARGKAEAHRAERESATFEQALLSIWPAFQPIVAAQNGEPMAFEALMRTTHPLLDSPLKMLEAGERLKKLPQLGQTMRDQVAAAIGRAPPDALFFINLHPLDLEDAHLFSPAAPLTAFASRVVLEITERASLAEIGGLESRIAQLRKLGYRIAVDDLGAGYAGLSSLAELRPEFVKLDASLIRGVEKDPVRQRLIAMLADFCHHHGARVIAEGVETNEERESLVANHCDWLQGYYFARPGKRFTEVESPSCN